VTVLAIAAPLVGLVAVGVTTVSRVYRLQRADWRRLEGLRGACAADSLARDGLAVARALYYAGTVLVGVLVLRGGGLTISDGVYFGSICLAAALLVARRRRADSALPPLIVYATLAYAFGGVLSSFVAPQPLSSLSVVVRVVYLVCLWFWIATLVLTRPEHVRTAALMLVVAAALNGVAAIAQTVTASAVLGGTYSWGRSTGLTTVPDDLGGLACVAIVPALNTLLPRAGYPSGQRVVAAVCVPLILAGLIFSGSIGAALAAVLGVAVWTVATHSYRYVAIGAAVATLALSYPLAAGALPYFKSPLSRLQQSTSQGNGEQSTFWTRMATNVAAWKSIEENPVVGVGLSPGDTTTSTGLAVHNMLLKQWFEGGIFAAAGELGICIAVGIAGWRAAVRARMESERLLAISLTVSYGCFLIWAMSEPQTFKRFCWVEGALLLAIRAQQIHSSRAWAPASARASLLTIGSAEAQAPRALPSLDQPAWLRRHQPT
jgi:O-antigen ligase